MCKEVYDFHDAIKHSVCSFAHSKWFYTGWVISHNIYRFYRIVSSYTKHLAYLHCFDANSVLSQITRCNRTECLCKWNDKYEVCIFIIWTISHSPETHLNIDICLRSIAFTIWRNSFNFLERYISNLETYICQISQIADTVCYTFP